MRAHPGARRHTATFNADERPHAEAEPPGCFGEAEAAFSVPGARLGRIPTHAGSVTSDQCCPTAHTAKMSAIYQGTNVLEKRRMEP